MKINWKKLSDKYAFWFVILIALILRFWNLGINPPSLYWDEVSQGYNSYSILKTGFDEHHEFLPIARFQAFGDYKAPVYIYLDVLPILLFGTTEFAIRFPSALLGVLTVVLTYFLAKEIFYEHRHRKTISFFSSLFLSLSPWHIQLSRVAYEANIATFFTVLGLFLFFIGKRKNNLYLIFSIISFVLAFYSFNAHRVFVPLLILLLSIVYFIDIKKHFKILVVGSVIGILMLLPFIFYLRTPESKLRFQEVNIFSDISVVKESNRLVQEDNNSMMGKIIHNRRFLYSLSYAKHYFDFFNPTYLFFKGDVNPRFSTQENGELYLYILPLLLIGMYAVVIGPGKNKFLLFGWFLLAPVAAATARETPHALRSETFIPIYELFAGFGTVILMEKLLRFGKRIVLITGLLFAALIIYYFIDFSHSYYVHMPEKYSQDWQYGYKQAVTKAEDLKNNYDEIIFSPIYGRAYIYALWYGKYDPSIYWQTGNVKRDAFGFYNVYGFGKYVFAKPNTIKIEPGKKVLYIGGPNEIPQDSRRITTINFLDGSVAYEIADNQR